MTDSNARNETDAPASPWRMPPMTARDDGAIEIQAPAKLNLTLRVGPRRDDGFHDLHSLVARIDLGDKLLCAARDDGEITLDCRPAAPCPTGKNLVYRAALRLREHCGHMRGAAITLTKRVPDGAGLGGGSADAAAALAALNSLWSCGLGAAELARLGAELGSDVPLSFSAAPGCVMSGRGERIEPAALADFAAVLLTSDIHCPTGEVYAAFDRLNPDAALGPEAAKAAAAILDRPPAAWPTLLTNDLGAAAMACRPALAELAVAFADATGLDVHVTGSGSGLFALCRDREHARQLAEDLNASGQLRGHCRAVGLKH